MFQKHLTEYFLSLPRAVKRLLVLSLDAALCICTVWIALCLQLETLVVLQGPYFTLALVSLGIALPSFTLFGFYHTIFRYSGIAVIATVGKGIGLYGFVFALVYTVIGVDGVPRSVGVLQPLMLMFFIMLNRNIPNYWLNYRNQKASGQLARVLIYGAGAAGRQLAAGMRNCVEMQLVGMLDDDKNLCGNILNSVKIYDPSDLVRVVKRTRASHVFLAIPSVSRTKRNSILHAIRNTRISVRTLPGLMDLAYGRVQVSDLRDLDIDDLLEREVVPADSTLLSKKVLGKVVLVTGAGGSIGRELCRQIFMLKPHTLLVLDMNEFSLYTVNSELVRLQPEGISSIKLVPLLANVCDNMLISKILSVWRPDVVYHAAAYKHVPLVEQNIVESVKNNVMGILVMTLESIKHDVRDFVFISTDKAVHPTNIMGASKRLSEMILQAHAADFHEQKNNTCFSMVRFGNVLGSSGSVVPKFRQQIRDGGPITLTHFEVTRFFMTISEAAQLVIQAGALANGGEVFLLDMGKPVKIVELARRMVELSGLSVKDDENPHGDIVFEVTGLHAGEKLHEELLLDGNPEPTCHPLILKAHEKFVPWPELQEKLNFLIDALSAKDAYSVRLKLKELIPDYQPGDVIVDWTFMENKRVATQTNDKIK